MSENIYNHSELPPLNLPPLELKVKSTQEGVRVYDVLREKYVALTPEEFVRQHFINWLVNYLHFPASNIAVESGIRVNGTKKRVDTMIVDRTASPLMIVEFKAPGVSITQDTFDQIVRYNMALRAKYLVVSNGLHHYCCVNDYERGTYHFIPKVPDYYDIILKNTEN